MSSDNVKHKVQFKEKVGEKALVPKMDEINFSLHC